MLLGSAVTTIELPIDNAPVAGTCIAPSESIVNLWVPSVKNFNWSLSELGAFSAVINVSLSISVSPPKGAQDSPAPNPSNCSVSVLKRM